MILLKACLSLLLTLTTITYFSQENSKSDCSILKNGKFKYLDADDTTSYIVMNSGKQTDYSGQNDYIIESEVKWIGDCSYTMKMTNITIPNFPFKPGDIMKVVINKIEGDIIYYTSTVKGSSWKGRFKKIG